MLVSQSRSSMKYNCRERIFSQHMSLSLHLQRRQLTNTSSMIMSVEKTTKKKKRRKKRKLKMTKEWRTKRRKKSNKPRLRWSADNPHPYPPHTPRSPTHTNTAESELRVFTLFDSFTTDQWTDRQADGSTIIASHTSSSSVYRREKSRRHEPLSTKLLSSVIANLFVL